MFHGGQSNIMPVKYRFAVQKIPALALVLFKSIAMQRDRQKSVIVFAVSGKFSEMPTGTKTNQFGSYYTEKVMMEVGVCFKHKIQSNILSRPNRKFAIYPCKY